MKRTGLIALFLVLAGCDLFPPPGGGSPRIDSVTPADAATNVAVGARVIATLELPNGGVDLTSVTPNAVRLVDVATGTPVAATVTPDNDALTLTLVPSEVLEFGSEYRFEVTPGVIDEDGRAFTDFSSTFTTVSSDVPSVIRSRPADGETNVSVNIESIAAEIYTNGGVTRGSLTNDSVYLTETASGASVAGEVGTSGGGDIITFNPGSALAPNTRYQFNVTSAVTDLSGAAFVPYTATFTTSGDAGPPVTSDIATVPQATAARQRHSSLAVDPSGTYLYALTAVGEVRRFPIGADGTLGAAETLNRLGSDSELRLAIGLTFDPASTASNPIVWVTHTALSTNFDGEVSRGDTTFWSGKLSRLSGPNLENIEDVVVGLPRSNKDHVTNSVAFNPAEPGVVYFVQGSNTAMGAPDQTWGLQPERVLSGAVLRLDTSLLGSLPLNAQTEDGGTYNPYAGGAPLTIYATGTRNSYDLVWHSNSNLYVPANGSAAGGNVPRYNPLPGTCENRPDNGYSGPVLDNPADVNGTYTATGTNDLGETVSVEGWRIDEQTLNDYLFKIEDGGYYGTPNPARCEWILNGGAVGYPGFPSTVVKQYPSGTGYDPNYRGPAGDFGQNISPNGALEYTGTAFPDLQGKLLVTRYSGGDDVVAVTLGSDGNATSIDPIINTPLGPDGRPILIDPLDIAQSPTTGYMYVSWFNDQGGESAPLAGITLLRPQ